MQRKPVLQWIPTLSFLEIPLPPLLFMHASIYPPPQTPVFIHQMAANTATSAISFQDFLPTMAERLGEQGLMQELCNGFRLLMDPARGLITFESLKRNAGCLGLEGLGDDELMGMIREGDTDSDGALNQMEFCVLMFRLSPELMAESWRCVDEAFQEACGFMS